MLNRLTLEDCIKISENDGEILIENGEIVGVVGVDLRTLCPKIYELAG